MAASVPGLPAVTPTLGTRPTAAASGCESEEQIRALISIECGMRERETIPCSSDSHHFRGSERCVVNTPAIAPLIRSSMSSSPTAGRATCHPAPSSTSTGPSAASGPACRPTLMPKCSPSWSLRRSERGSPSSLGHASRSAFGRPCGASRSLGRWAAREGYRTDPLATVRPLPGVPRRSDSVGGTDLRALAADDVRATIGVVSQRVDLFDATIRDNLALAEAVGHDPLGASPTSVQGSHMVEAVQGHGSAHRDGTYSGHGVAQRVTQARCPDGSVPTGWSDGLIPRKQSRTSRPRARPRSEVLVRFEHVGLRTGYVKESQAPPTCSQVVAQHPKRGSDESRRNGE